MRVSTLSLALALCLPLPVLAGNPTADCMAEATTPEAQAACIGLSAEACRKRPTTTQPTDVAACYADEHGWWRKRMLAAAEAMTARAEKLDVPYSKQIAAGMPRLADDTQIMLDAWQTWVEKRCTFEGMLHRNSPRRMVYAAACHMRLTAEQSLFLEASAKTN